MIVLGINCDEFLVRYAQGKGTKNTAHTQDELP
jgi:hypothetical protein